MAYERFIAQPKKVLIAFLQMLFVLDVSVAGASCVFENFKVKTWFSKVSLLSSLLSSVILISSCKGHKCRVNYLVVDLVV